MLRWAEGPLVKMKNAADLINAIIENKRQRSHSYWAASEDALRNGSFYRVSRLGISRFMNGDYMGMVAELPRGGRYRQFYAVKAEELIPASCK